jgi:diguanylate cyclase (GGDEF)-like protein
MFDVDHFKKVNDTYGHKAGDIILKQVVQLAKMHLRKFDIIGRYGGEEFIICLPNTARQDAVHIAEKIRTEIETKQVEVDGKEITVTLSLGVSIGAIQDSEVTNSKLIAALMHEADMALYTAKNNGRNCVRSTEKYAVIF